jgi:hypothetical protein
MWRNWRLLGIIKPTSRIISRAAHQFKPRMRNLSLVCELSGRVHTGSVRLGRWCWVVDETQHYSAAEMERMMKVQDMLLKAMAKKITLVGGGGNHRGDGSGSVANGC